MNAVVYARYSSHKQGEQSIEGQLAEAQSYAEKHGLTIIHEYCDRALTGRNDNREQFQLMLADAAKHAFDALIVWKTDRIGRNKEEIALNKYHLKKNGVKIYYIAESIPDTPEGIILESVIEGMAAYYSEQLSQNIRRGQRASAAKAQSTGGTRPLGYKTGPDKKFVIDPETAPTVQLVFDLYAKGQTIAQIVRTLNEQGRRTSRGKPFSDNSLRTMLKNEKYIGTYTYKDEVRIENAIPPIIEPEVFYKVQEMLRYNQKAAARKNPSTEFLLTEKIFCGKCGAAMIGVSGTGHTGARYHYYSCAQQKKKQCNKKAVRQAWIERLVLEKTLQLLKDDALLDFIAEQTYQYYLAQNTESEYTRTLQSSLAEVEKSISNLIRALEAGIFNEATKKRMDELDEQREELKAALAAVKLRQDLGLKKEDIVHFLHQFADFDMDCADLDCQKRLIKVFVNAVFVYDDKVTITFNYSNDDRTITLPEIDAGSLHPVHLPRAMFHQKRQDESPAVFCVEQPKENIVAFLTFQGYNILRQANQIMHKRHFSLWGKYIAGTSGSNLIKMQIPFCLCWVCPRVQVGLATIGVCVFCAAASVAALFVVKTKMHCLYRAVFTRPLMRSSAKIKIWRSTMITEERSTGKETAALAKRCKKFAPLLIVFLLAIVVAVILGMQLRNARNAQRSLSQELVLQKETIEKLREAKNSSATTGPIVDAKPVITNSVVTDRLSTVNNLITAEYLYTNAGQYVNNKQTTIVNVDIGIPFTKKTFLVAYDGRVAAGVDLSKAGIDVDESAKTITITLPKSTITYHEIFEDSLVVVDEKDGLFNKITISDYTEFAEAQKAKMEKKAIERGILKNADEEAKTIVTTVLSSLPGAEEYELVIR